MSPEAQPETAPEVSEQTLSPLQVKAEAYRFAVAGTLRSVSAVSAAAATNLETGGPFAELCGLIAALDRLRTQLGDQLECLGAAWGSSGSA